MVTHMLEATVESNGVRGVEITPGVFVLENGFVGTILTLKAHGAILAPATGPVEISDKALERARRYAPGGAQ